MTEHRKEVHERREERGQAIHVVVRDGWKKGDHSSLPASLNDYLTANFTNFLTYKITTRSSRSSSSSKPACGEGGRDGGIARSLEIWTPHIKTWAKMCSEFYSFLWHMQMVLWNLDSLPVCLPSCLPACLFTLWKFLTELLNNIESVFGFPTEWISQEWTSLISIDNFFLFSSVKGS